MNVRTSDLTLRTELRSLIDRMRESVGIRQAATVLRQACDLAGFTQVAIVFDSAHPDAPVDEEGRDVAEVLGWPRAYIDHWLTARSKNPASVQARFEFLPFIWMNAARARPRDDVLTFRGASVDELDSIGVTGGLVVPVRLPRGRLATIVWFGQVTTEHLKRVRAELEPELLLLAYYYLERVRERSDPPPVLEDMANLSPRELQCLTAVAKGMSDREVALEAGLSAHTVRFHLRNAAGKLGARSRSHAVALATQLGILGSIF